MQNFQERVKKFWADVNSRRNECLSEGHSEPYWFPYAVSNRSSHRDVVSGMCKYCLSSLERPLNGEEHERITEFYRSLDDPMTI
jgi:hypothetical protein